MLTLSSACGGEGRERGRALQARVLSLCPVQKPPSPQPSPPTMKLSGEREFSGRATMLAETLRHLRALVAFDTRNPPRAIGTGGIFEYLRAQLPGFDCTVTDHGAGAVSLYAVRG